MWVLVVVTNERTNLPDDSLIDVLLFMFKINCSQFGKIVLKLIPNRVKLPCSLAQGDEHASRLPGVDSADRLLRTAEASRF